MHSRGVCHRDIKMENILIKKDFSKIKLVDLGVSKKFLSANSDNNKGINKNRESIRNMMFTVTGAT